MNNVDAIGKRMSRNQIVVNFSGILILCFALFSGVPINNAILISCLVFLGIQSLVTCEGLFYIGWHMAGYGVVQLLCSLTQLVIIASLFFKVD